MPENLFLHRVLIKLACLVLLPACLAAGIAAMVRQVPAVAPSVAASELPREWNGRALRPLALSEVETRFAARFPGSLARMTDGEQVLVLRTVRTPTRMLHPAADCYRAVGWRIGAQRLEQDADQALWRCFEAERGGQRMRVCERIVAADGTGFTDTSAWYWAAALGQSHGPWHAVTVARAL